MRISKTLFKNFIRCANFPSLYDMYINRGAHNVTEIDGEKVSTLENDVNQMSDTTFTELDDKSMEIFTSMFDEETGVDLTNVTSAQLQAFAETFVEVGLEIVQSERLPVIRRCRVLLASARG